jgi:hypothetical protein
VLLGGVFLLLGVIVASSGSGGEWGYFLLAMGLLFAAWGVSYFVSARRMSQK